MTSIVVEVVSRTEAAEGIESSAFGFVVGDEEVFDLVDERLVQVVDGPDVGVRARDGGDGDQAVVALDLTVGAGLLGLDHADQTAAHEAPDERRLVHQHEYVERVAVPALRPRDEAEIERK